MTSLDLPDFHLPRHPVRAVVTRTGLSAHVLRAWERRYGLVSPTRTAAGQRLYSDADIAQLTLLRTLAAAGERVSLLARLPIEELQRLAQTAPLPTVATTVELRHSGEWRRDALEAIESMDATSLRRGLERGAVALGVPRLLEEVVTPVFLEIGERWHAGRMTIAQEHLASEALRQVLGWFREVAEAGKAAPGLVVGTPPGQVHEGGALMAAAIAACEGWRVSYLGADLPVAEIADSARRTGARAVALSIVYPADDPEIGNHIRSLGRALPQGVTLMVGGAAATAYADAITDAKGKLLQNLGNLRDTLRELGVAASGPA